MNCLNYTELQTTIDFRHYKPKRYQLDYYLHMLEELGDEAIGWYDFEEACDIYELDDDTFSSLDCELQASILQSLDGLDRTFTINYGSSSSLNLTHSLRSNAGYEDATNLQCKVAMRILGFNRTRGDRYPHFNITTLSDREYSLEAWRKQRALIESKDISRIVHQFNSSDSAIHEHEIFNDGMQEWLP